MSGVPYSTCCRLYRKWRLEQSVTTKPRAGRPKKFTAGVVQAIDHIIKQKDDIVASEIESKLVARFGQRFQGSRRRISSIRRELGYQPSKGYGQDELTAEQKNARMKYCRRHINDQWSNVVFTDEKPWILGKRRRPLWRRDRMARRTYVRTKYPIKLSCWGGISFKGKTSLVIWKGRQKSQQYINTLQQSLLPFAATSLPRRWRLQQDRDTTHTSKLTREWLAANVPSTFETPTKSPDLNPIEKIWNTLEQRVYKHNPKTEPALKRWIKYEWNHLEQQIVDNSIRGMMHLIPDIIEADGEYVESKRGYRH